jgi:DnaK suppressor protein
MSEIAIIKKRLLERKIELEEELKRLSREKVGDEQVPDPADQIAIATQEDLNISLQHTEMQEYSRILKALDLIEQGGYGVCIDCQQPISEKRLHIYPDATRCLACQEAQEEFRQ